MLKRLVIMLFIAWSALFQTLRGQWYAIFKDDIGHVLNTGKALITAPGSFDRSDWMRLGLTVGGTPMLFTLDKSAQDIALNNRSDFNDALFRLDKYYGNEKTLYYCAGIYGLGLVTQKKGVRRLGLQAAEAVVYSNMVTSFFKSALGRRRPYGGESNMFFAPWRGGEAYHSLPSGHATASFAFATVLAEYRQELFWRTFWYGSAFVIAGARLYHNKHWLSDVFAGGMIGYSFGRFIARYDRAGEERQTHWHPSWGFNHLGIEYHFP